MTDQRGTANDAELARLAADFPAYDFTLTRLWPARPCLVARARTLGTHPHTLMTSNPGELRAELDRARPPGPRPE